MRTHLIGRTTMAASCTLLCFGAATTTPHAQSVAMSNQAAFDTISIKPNPSGAGPVGMRIQPGGLFTASNLTLQGLLQNAYGAIQRAPTLDSFRIIGAPAWAGADRFNIVAKAAGTITREQMALMLQSLLADRFKLTLHHEMRELPVYALVMTRSDGKLGAQLRAGENECKDAPPVAGQPRPTSCAPPFGPPGRVTARAMSMAQLAINLSSRVNRVVLDHTGLPGVFAVDLQWAPDPSEGAGPLGPPPPPVDGPPRSTSDGVSLSTALQEQLGLKLESTKRPVDVIVIDHVERPSEN